MRKFKDYISINEWKLTNDSDIGFVYKYFPKDTVELRKIIIKKFKENEIEPYLLDINTSNIKTMVSLFSSDLNDYLGQNDIDTTKTVKIDIHTWDLSNVITFNYMFYECISLEEIYFGKYKILKKSESVLMFYNCKSLKTIKNVDIFENSSVSPDMFDYCNKNAVPNWYYSRSI